MPTRNENLKTTIDGVEDEWNRYLDENYNQSMRKMVTELFALMAQEGIIITREIEPGIASTRAKEIARLLIDNLYAEEISALNRQIQEDRPNAKIKADILNAKIEDLSAQLLAMLNINQDTDSK